MATKKLNESMNQTDNADFSLNNMRTEVQKIIDDHLKGDDKWFSVMDWNYEKLNTLINLLT